MRLDVPYLIAELLVMWLPLSLGLLVTDWLGLNWIITALVLIGIYIFTVWVCQTNDFLRTVFRVQKATGNSVIEALTFIVVTLLMLWVVLKWVSNAAAGISILLFVSILTSALVIGKEKQKYGPDFAKFK